MDGGGVAVDVDVAAADVHAPAGACDNGGNAEGNELAGTPTTPGDTLDNGDAGDIAGSELAVTGNVPTPVGATTANEEPSHDICDVDGERIGAIDAATPLMRSVTR